MVLVDGPTHFATWVHGLAEGLRATAVGECCYRITVKTMTAFSSLACSRHVVNPPVRVRHEWRTGGGRLSNRWNPEGPPPVGAGTPNP